MKYKEKRFIDKYFDGRFSKDLKVLDIGCGYGRLLKDINAKGFDVEGVEKNEEIRNKLIGEGYNIHSPEEIQDSNKQYDVLIMSHIVEHFQSDDLLAFMDGYLDSLKSGGYLLILTPVMSDKFYADFDHVKPYDPRGIIAVFGDKNAQVQYYSRNKLELMDFNYRKEEYKIDTLKEVLLKEHAPLKMGMNIIFNVLYKLSGSRIGRKTGWMGLFRKK